MTQAFNLAQFANNLNTSGATSNAGLQNSAVTVTAGTGLSGGGSVALGSSVTLNNAGVTSVTAGSGISVSASTGGVTISTSGGGGVTSLNGQTGAITNTNIDSIGSYICAVLTNSIGSGLGDGTYFTANTGDTTSGSGLRRNFNAPFAGAFPSTNQRNIPSGYDQGGTALSGTYRCMGRAAGYQVVLDGAQGYWISSLWVRIS
jgi:hypothetical protein